VLFDFIISADLFGSFVAGRGPDRRIGDGLFRDACRLSSALVEKLAFLCGCIVVVALASVSPVTPGSLPGRALALSLAVIGGWVLRPIYRLCLEWFYRWCMSVWCMAVWCMAVRCARDACRLSCALVEKLAFLCSWGEAIALASIPRITPGSLSGRALTLNLAVRSSFLSPCDGFRLERLG